MNQAKNYKTQPRCRGFICIMTKQKTVEEQAREEAFYREMCRQRNIEVVGVIHIKVGDDGTPIDEISDRKGENPLDVFSRLRSDKNVVRIHIRQIKLETTDPNFAYDPQKESVCVYVADHSSTKIYDRNEMPFEGLELLF